MESLFKRKKDLESRQLHFKESVAKCEIFLSVIKNAISLQSIYIFMNYCICFKGSKV